MPLAKNTGESRRAVARTSRWMFAAEISSLRRNGFCMLDEFILDAGHGPCCFHVWWDIRQRGFLVIKDASVPCLVVIYELTTADQCIHAEFATLGGRVFASKDFSVEVVTPDEPLLLIYLENAAQEQALEQNLVESTPRVMELMISGVHRVLPCNLILWNRNTIDEAAFEMRLTHLRSLTNASDSELAASCLFDDGASSDMDDASSDMDGDSHDRDGLL